MSNDLKNLRAKLQELTKDTDNLNITKIQLILSRIEKVKAYNKAYTKKYYENVRKEKLVKERMKEKQKLKRTCAICGKEFIPFSVTGKYCSEECKKIGAKQRRQERTASGELPSYYEKYKNSESYKRTQARYRKSAKGKATFKKYYDKYKANGYKALHKNTEEK